MLRLGRSFGVRIEKGLCGHPPQLWRRRMKDLDTKSLSFDAYDDLRNQRPSEQDFDRVVASA